MLCKGLGSNIFFGKDHNFEGGIDSDQLCNDGRSGLPCTKDSTQRAISVAF